MSELLSGLIPDQSPSTSQGSIENSDGDLPFPLPKERDEFSEGVADGRKAVSDIGAQPYRWRELPGESPEFGDVVADDEVRVMIEFGSIVVSPAELERIGPATLLTLPHGEQEDVNLVVDGDVVARGRAIIVNGKLAVEITQLLGNVLAEDTAKDTEKKVAA